MTKPTYEELQAALSILVSTDPYQDEREQLGHIMRALRGKANPAHVMQLLLGKKAEAPRLLCEAYAKARNDALDAASDVVLANHWNDDASVQRVIRGIQALKEKP